MRTSPVAVFSTVKRLLGSLQDVDQVESLGMFGDIFAMNKWRDDILRSRDVYLNEVSMETS